MKRALHFLVISILLVIVIVTAGCGRNDDTNSTDSKVQWITPDKLKQGPIRNPSLTDEQMAQIQRLQKIFSEVDPSSLDQWINDFKRDANPENEIRTWGNMAYAYQTFTTTNNLAIEAKKEAYQIVLLRSAAPADEVLKHLKLKTLTEAQAKVIMQLYNAKPEPIRVVAP